VVDEGKKKKKKNQIQELRRLRQEDHEFKANSGYIVSERPA
jgi:hypothetical protein